MKSHFKPQTYAGQPPVSNHKSVTPLRDIPQLFVSDLKISMFVGGRGGRGKRHVGKLFIVFGGTKVTIGKICCPVFFWLFYSCWPELKPFVKHVVSLNAVNRKISSGKNTLTWGRRKKPTPFDVGYPQLTVFTQGKAVFVVAGDVAAFTVGVDSKKNNLQIYDIVIEQHFLSRAGGFIGE